MAEREIVAGTSSPAPHCEWCGAEATTTIEVQPVFVGVRRMDLPIRAAACDEHALQVTAPQGLAPDAWMRRKARGVEQTTIFSIPVDDGPGSAIHQGDGAA